MTDWSRLRMQRETDVSESELEKPLVSCSVKCAGKNETDSLSNFQEVTQLKNKTQENNQGIEIFLSEDIDEEEESGACLSKSPEETLELKLENLLISDSVEKKQVSRKNTSKIKPHKLAVTLKYAKCGRKIKARKLLQKISRIKQKYKTAQVLKKKKNSMEKKVEMPKKGKRGQLGGKAKAKPPVQANEQKYESDEEIDYFYFNRISLGQFQKLRDDSGASTSNQQESIASGVPSLHLQEETLDSTTEELELLELEEWGRSFFISKNQFLHSGK